MAGCGFAVHTACGGFQGSVEGKGSVPIVLEAVALNSPWRQRQNGIEPIQSLNGGLFIDAEHGSMLGRIQIKADDVGRLGLEIGVVAGHVPLKPVGLQTSLLPNAMHGILAHSQSRRQLTATPVRRAILGRLAGRSQNPRPQPGSEHRRLLSGVSCVQSVQSMRQKALLPAADRWSCRSQPLLDRAVRGALGQHQNQPGAEDIAGRQGPGLSDTAELKLLFFGK